LENIIATAEAWLRVILFT